MSNCDLVIELDQPDNTFVPGEKVTGTVVLTPDRDLDLTELVIEQIWETHGRGNRNTGRIARHGVNGQRCVAGRSCRFPFGFEVPCYPLSYHGTLVNVDHYITARADVPWKMDPRARIDYLVVPGARSRQAAISAALGEDEPQAGGGGRGKLIYWLFAPVIALLGLMLLSLLVVLLPILLLVGLVKLIRRAAAERKLGKVAVEVVAECLKEDGQTGRVRIRKGPVARLREGFAGLKPQSFVTTPGDTIPVTVNFKPAASVDLSSITLTLKARESATSGSGTNSRTYTETLVEEQAQLLGSRRVAGGSPVELRGEITLPVLEAWTFKAPSNSIAWSLVLRIAIPRSPDWVQEHALVVVPPPAEDEGEAGPKLEGQQPLDFSL